MLDKFTKKSSKNLMDNKTIAKYASALIKQFDQEHLASGHKALYITGKELACILTELINPEYKPVIDCGNWEQAALATIEHLIKKIEKNPEAWKKFHI